MIENSVVSEMHPLSLQKIRHYIFAKHHIVPGYQSESIVEVARNLLGLHSARLSTPYVTLFSRVLNFQTKDLRDSSFVTRKLVRVRCMRKTLHTIPLDFAPILHQATLSFRVADCLRVYRQLEIPNGLIQKTQEQIIEIIQKEPTSSKQIQEFLLKSHSQRNEHLPEEIWNKFIKTVIKQLWEEGVLCYLNMSDHWGSEDRVYGYTKLLYPDLQLYVCSPTDAQQWLVYSHIDRFGPVTEADICWWSGLSRNVVQKSINSSANHVYTVRLEGFNETFYMSAADRDMFEDFTPSDKHWLRLLAYEDPSLKGYFETRTRYVEPQYYHALFNQIGEARASIMVNGEIVGIWSWDKQNHRVVWQTFTQIRPDLLKSLHEACTHLEDCLNEGIVQYHFF